MTARNPRLGLLVFAALLLACGPAEQEQAPGKIPTATVSGTYEVKGVTVDEKSGSKREIDGRIILAQEGNHYTATFDLSTTYPTADGLVPADVIGKGEGTIEGNTLTGKAQTQIVQGTVEGVDTAFAFVPRLVSARIISKSKASVKADGTLHVEIRNEPAPGEKQYRPTRTTLEGQRVEAAHETARKKATR